MNMTRIGRCIAYPLVVATMSALNPAHAANAANDSAGLSELSAISLLPVAMVATVGSAFIADAASLSVVAVEASAEGVVWIVERASDGVRATVRFARDAAVGLSIAAGQMITVVAMGTGWLLCAAGRTLAFVPNETGSRLLYSQRITR